jgi:hypothetical protein
VAHGLRLPRVRTRDNTREEGRITDKQRMHFRPTPTASLVLLALASAAGAHAATPQLAVPIDCRPEDGCSIQNYVDLDRGAGVRDFGCGVLTYDGHRGTDFQVRDLARMRAGVPVVAAAPGVVRALRDEMPDTGKAAYEAARESERALGNAVVIDHGDGWSTSYGHLRRGSVRVRPGERVAAGQPLGLVGLSGDTEFPHVHFEVRKDGQVVDPFVGAGAGAACGETAASLWTAQARARLPYTPTGVLCSGWSDAAVERSAILDDCDRSAALSTQSASLVWWVEVYGVRKDDRLRVALLGPDGAVLGTTTAIVAKDRAREFRYFGKPRPAGGWSAGRYRARLTLTRADGTSVLDLTGEVELR